MTGRRAQPSRLLAAEPGASYHRGTDAGLRIFLGACSVTVQWRILDHPAHGLITLTPHSEKSSTLRVATAAPRDRAIAAIWASAAARGRPARLLAAAMRA